MGESFAALEQRIKTQEEGSGRLWETLDKLLTAVNEIKLSLTHLEILSKKDAEQDEKINQIREQISGIEKRIGDFKVDIVTKYKDIETELKIWRFGVITTVALLASVVAGNLELLRSFF